MAPAFIPAAFLEPPGVYGETQFAVWRMVAGASLAQLTHAKWQHDIVVGIRRWCDQHRKGEAETYIAEAVGDTRATVLRKMTGRAVASATDLLGWIAVTGIEVYPVPQEMSDLVPDVSGRASEVDP